MYTRYIYLNSILLDFVFLFVPTNLWNVWADFHWQIADDIGINLGLF